MYQEPPDRSPKPTKTRFLTCFFVVERKTTVQEKAPGPGMGLLGVSKMLTFASKMKIFKSIGNHFSDMQVTLWDHYEVS